MQLLLSLICEEYQVLHFLRLELVKLFDALNLLLVVRFEQLLRFDFECIGDIGLHLVDLVRSVVDHYYVMELLFEVEHFVEVAAETVRVVELVAEFVFGVVRLVD